MANDEDTGRYTMDDIKAMRARGEDYSDDARLERMTDADIEAQAADEPEFDWSIIYLGIPPKSAQATVHLDQDVLDWFKAQGDDHETRINAVLRAYMDARTGGGR